MGLFWVSFKAFLKFNQIQGVTGRVSRRSILGPGSTLGAWVLTDQRQSDAQKGRKGRKMPRMLLLTMRKSIVCRNVNFNGSGKGGLFEHVYKKYTCCLFRCNCNGTIKIQIINNCCFLLIALFTYPFVYLFPDPLALLNTLHYHRTQYIYLSARTHKA